MLKCETNTKISLKEKVLKKPSMSRSVSVSVKASQISNFGLSLNMYSSTIPILIKDEHC